MEYKEYVFGEYVFTPCKNAFNDKTSYWISKDGYTISSYAFTPTSQHDLEEQIKEKNQYISLFDARIERLNAGYEKEQETIKHKGLSVFQMLDMSTGHITKETNAKLLNNNINIAYYHKPEFGFLISVPEDIDDFYDVNDIPEDLYKCLCFAIEKGFQWINLDCDGAVIKELPIYNW